MKISVQCSMQADHDIGDLASWAKNRRLTLTWLGKKMNPASLPKNCYSLTVHKRGFRASIGTAQLFHGRWQFVARPENADDYDLTGHDLSLSGVWHRASPKHQYKPRKKLVSASKIKQLIPHLVRAAQQVYDDWDQDDTDTYGGGGICHLIADEFVNILQEANIDCSTVSSDHEQHVYTVARVAEGVYSVDIHWSIYETGGGFTWKKLPDIKFDSGDVTLYRITSDPKEFEEISGYEG